MPFYKCERNWPYGGKLLKSRKTYLLLRQEHFRGNLDSLSQPHPPILIDIHSANVSLPIGKEGAVCQLTRSNGHWPELLFPFEDWNEFERLPAASDDDDAETQSASEFSPFDNVAESMELDLQGAGLLMLLQ